VETESVINGTKTTTDPARDATFFATVVVVLVRDFFVGFERDDGDCSDGSARDGGDRAVVVGAASVAGGFGDGGGSRYVRATTISIKKFKVSYNGHVL
jgi:hypothetical protein